MDRLNGRPFNVDTWLVEPDLNRISAGERVRKLEPRTMDVLVYLANHAGAVISRDELLNAVWEDCFVTENTLSRTISRLRKALGDDWQQPRFLETISKSGYRLIAPVAGERPAVKVTAGPRQMDLTRAKPSRRIWGLPGLLVAAAAVVGTAAAVWLARPRAGLVPVPSPVVTLIGKQMNPVLSPDGQHVAFAWQGHTGDNWDIYVQSFDTDNPRRLTEEPYPQVLPAWSPDGRFLAFAAGPDRCGIYRVPLTGGPAVRLADCLPQIRHLAWSPNGRRLAFDAQPEDIRPQTLYLVGLDGDEPRSLTPPDAGSQGDWQPAFSPDGNRIAFSRRQTRDLHHLYVIASEGGVPARVTGHVTGRIRGHDWTADGRALIYSYNRDGRFALWRIPVDGGEPQRLPVYDDWVTYPSVARKTSKLIYKNYADVIDLWSVALDPSRTAEGEPYKVVPSTRSELHPRLARSGRLAFLSNRTGAFEVWSGEARGTALIRHTRLEGHVAGLLDWSPDGSELVFDARRNGQSDLFVVEAESRNPKPLTKTAWDEVNPNFSGDGLRLYFAANRSGTWEIYRMRRNGSGESRLTVTGGFYAREGPEGDKLYYAKLNQSAIFRVPVAGGAEEKVWQGLGPMDWGSWQVCPSGIYYIDRNQNAIMHQALTGPPRQVLKAPRTFPYLGPAFSVSADERLLTFGQIAQSDDEIMAVYR